MSEQTATARDDGASKERNGASGRRRRNGGTAPLGFSAEEWPFVVVLVSNWALAGVLFFGLSPLISWMPDNWTTIEDKLFIVVRDVVFAAVPMLVAIAVVAAQRLNPSMMVGHQARPNSALDINTRFILNTAEQYVLFVIGQFGLMLFAPRENVKNLIILTVIWLLGRALFWIGYHRNPYLRAFGFGLTFYPTVMIFVWLLVMFATGYRLF